MFLFLSLTLIRVENVNLKTINTKSKYLS